MFTLRRTRYKKAFNGAHEFEPSKSSKALLEDNFDVWITIVFFGHIDPRLDAAAASACMLAVKTHHLATSVWSFDGGHGCAVIWFAP